MKIPENSIIASGPVIVKKMDGQVKTLLNIHKKTKDKPNPQWQFCGGEVENFDATLEEAAIRECKEEMGISVKIIKPLKPMMIKREDGSIVLLIHYLADYAGEITLGEEIARWGWFTPDELPKSTAPNVEPLLREAIKEF